MLVSEGVSEYGSKWAAMHLGGSACVRDAPIIVILN
jgi:hypothetical protein